MHCHRCSDFCSECFAEIREQTAEIKRLRDELSYIANAKRLSSESADEFWAWAQNRARHALRQEAGTLTIKKG